jgi:Uma2 family endonuclease
MQGLARKADFVSAEEYLERERAAETKSEYFNGVIVAMAGVTLNHDTIAVNVVSLLNSQLRGRPCRVFSSDVKVRIERANAFRYPDASALCGPIAFHDRVCDAYCNPSFLCEVLSPSSEAYDLADKFALYRLIDSFVEYLVVAQDRCWAQLFRRGRAGGWECSEFTSMDDVITLESVGCTLRMGELFDKVDLA